MMDLQDTDDCESYEAVKDLSEAPLPEEIGLPDAFIDLKEVSEKEKITNTDIILSILEIAFFKYKYNNAGRSNRTIKFWRDAKKNKIVKRIFYGIGASILKVMWENMVYVNVIQFFLVVLKNKEFINDSRLLLKSIVKLLIGFIHNQKEKDLVKYVAQQANKLK